MLRRRAAALDYYYDIAISPLAYALIFALLC